MSEGLLHRECKCVSMSENLEENGSIVLWMERLLYFPTKSLMKYLVAVV